MGNKAFVSWVSAMFVASTIAGCAVDGDASGEPAGDDVVRSRPRLERSSRLACSSNTGCASTSARWLNPTNPHPNSVTALTACEPKVFTR